MGCFKSVKSCKPRAIWALGANIGIKLVPFKYADK